MAKTGSAADWIEVIRIFGLPCGILPALLGGAFAHQFSYFSLSPFLFLLTGVLLVHIASNITNEYYDVHQGIDTADQDKPSTVLAEGRIEPELALFVSRALIVLSLIGLSIYGIYTELWGIFIIAPLGMAGGYFYTAPPLQLKFRGLGLPANFIFLGLLIPQAVYYGLSGELYLYGLGLSLPMSILTVAILWSNDMRDIEADEDIITLVGILGLARSIYIYFLLLFLPYILAGYYYWTGDLSALTFLQLFTLPLAVKLAKTGREGVKNNPRVLSHLDQKTAVLMVVFNIIWIISYLTA